MPREPGSDLGCTTAVGSCLKVRKLAGNNELAVIENGLVNGLLRLTDIGFVHTVQCLYLAEDHRDRTPVAHEGVVAESTHEPDFSLKL